MSYETIRKTAEQHRKPHPEWFYIYKSNSIIAEYYAPELVALLRKNTAKQAPEGWRTATSLANEFRVNNAVIKGFVQSYRTKCPIWFGNYKAGGKNIAEHYHPDLVALIRAHKEK